MARNEERDLMIVVSDIVMNAISHRDPRLSKEGAVVAAFVGVLSVCRCDGIPEEPLLREAARACPRVDRSQGRIVKPDDPWGKTTRR